MQETQVPSLGQGDALEKGEATEAFPELRGKKFWITEWRDRSDEEVPSHQRFRETLNKSAFMLMMVAHPDVDGMNLHEFRCQTGSLMWSN